MTTRFIGLRELRQNMASVTKDASRKRQRVIVLKKNMPLFELRPLSADEIALASFDRDINHAREQARNGDTYAMKDVRDMLGLKPYEI